MPTTKNNSKPPFTTPPVGANQLAKAGMYLFGVFWQAAMAKKLGVDPATVSRWLKADGHPQAIGVALLALTTLAHASRGEHAPARCWRCMGLGMTPKGSRAEDCPECGD